jgi:hypothetical protein
MTTRLSKARQHPRSLRGDLHRVRSRSIRPAVAHRQRGSFNSRSAHFTAPETWYEPRGLTEIKYVVHAPGKDYIHPITVEDVRNRIAMLPAQLTKGLEVVQFSAMTRKRQLFPLYGMQWGSNIYLYPIESSLTETYYQPPTPQQLIEAKMFGGKWEQVTEGWTLSWSLSAIRDFYLNNVLIHEIGHVHDSRNTNSAARERYANWFATEYGFRASRGRS